MPTALVASPAKFQLFSKLCDCGPGMLHCESWAGRPCDRGKKLRHYSFLQLQQPLVMIPLNLSTKDSHNKQSF
jgi:hypothetical protein